MLVIPVLDLLDGQAVHAVRGRRDDYRPIRSLLAATSEPLALAPALVAASAAATPMLDVQRCVMSCAPCCRRGRGSLSPQETPRSARGLTALPLPRPLSGLPIVGTLC